MAARPCCDPATVHIPDRPSTALMADRRPEGEESRFKRQKTSADMDPRANPYLAHMYEGTNSNSKSNAALAKFKRHQTTASLAKEAEDGPNNLFSGRPLSQKYFNILKVRRDLPVHAQRYESCRHN